MPNTIKLKKYEDICNEFIAEAVVLPGTLVKVSATGGVVVNDVIATKPSVIVPLEDELQGKTIVDAYAIGDPVQTWAVQPGEEVQMKATGAIALGAQVEAVADGTVKVVAAGVPIGVATWAAVGGFVGVRII